MANLELSNYTNKETAFERTASYLSELNIGVAEVDNQRPWGGFFLIDTAYTDRFIDTFFPEVNKDEIYKYGTELSPKILLVEPEQQLSWQYHNRRAELWKAVLGSVGVKVSIDDTIPEQLDVLQEGEVVQHDNQVRHRLIGLGKWGVVAEIWQHTVEGNPSDESDIIRLEDGYGRS